MSQGMRLRPRLRRQLNPASGEVEQGPPSGYGFVVRVRRFVGLPALPGWPQPQCSRGFLGGHVLL